MHHHHLTEEPSLANPSPYLTSTLLAAAVAINASETAEDPPLLGITLPTNDEIVRPSLTRSVTVTYEANAEFAAVGVVSEEPIGETSPVASRSF
jgi:hypothetical protein